MKFLRTAICVSALAISGSAMAADPVMSYGTDPAFDWSGFYAGAEVGGVREQASNLPGSVNWIGPMIDVVAGYNFQQDNMLFGLETDIGYATAKYSGPCGNPAWTCEGYVNWQGSLRGRLGLVVDNFLMYLTGGVAVANVGGKTISPANVEFPDSSVRVGYTVGGGVEAAMTDMLSARVQYQYSNYGSRDMTFDIPYPGVAVDSHAVKFGLLAHFN